MTILDLMKADAEACNKRMRRLWGINRYVMGQEGRVGKRCEKVAARRKKVLAMFEGGMTRLEISQKLNMPPETVKTDIAEARLAAKQDEAA